MHRLLADDRPISYFPGESARASLKHHVGERAETVMSSARFPGRISPGLIEACDICIRCTCGRTFPGRISPGLIEAGQSEGRRISRPPSGFPGRISPGLIEATADPAEAIRSDADGDFPGESARASLKPRESGRTLTSSHRGRNFPGESARASLKPGTPRIQVAARSSPYFPGESARASLKQIGDRRRMRSGSIGGDHFPGESARASLKRIVVKGRIRRPPRGQEISRANQPGPH